MPFNRQFYYVGLALVAGLSFGLRFWQLGRFNALVFDEVYYVQFAQAYLAGGSVFDAHPPMGKYAIAAGIWLYNHTSWLHFSTPTVTAEVNLASVSYRWMNALAGSLVPLVVVGLARSLTDGRNVSQGWLFGLVAGGFVAIDGLFVTESRYGLLNIYVVFFGLLGHWLWMAARRAHGPTVKRLLRGLCGVALGAAIATKWNGLGYVLALVLWEGWQQRCKTTTLPWFPSSGQVRSVCPGKLRALLRGTLYLGLLPFLTYCLIWWPHLQLNGASFLSIHQTLLAFHQGLDEMQVACSQWFTWPLLIKPIAYWYEQAETQVYTVNNLGNPVLWWFSGAAVVLLVAERLTQFVKRLGRRGEGGLGRVRAWPPDADPQTEVVGYLLVGYLANWLPWIVVERCTYIYLYMPAAVFGFMLLAWVVSGWLGLASAAFSRWMGFVVLGVIALAFFFWLPLALGAPLSPEQLGLRWWLPSWI